MANPFPAILASLLLLAGPAVATAPEGVRAGEAPGWDKLSGAMQHVTIHVPRVTMTTTIIATAVPLPPRMTYREKKADECIKTEKVVGFAVQANDSVDFILESGKRLRAKLGASCRVLGFYTGLYVKPHPDGKMCVGRDRLRSRSGTSCGIEEFRHLIPVKPEKKRK